MDVGLFPDPDRSRSNDFQKLERFQGRRGGLVRLSNCGRVCVRCPSQTDRLLSGQGRFTLLECPLHHLGRTAPVPCGQ